jgi:hypothetical protein
MQQFDKFQATELFCPKCRTAQPVRERLLLVLPHAELYEYRCVTCASSLGQREVKAPSLTVARPHPSVPPPPARPSRAPVPRGMLGPRAHDGRR